MPQTWQLSSCSEFRWREIDGEWLVYHLGRYQYHVLDVVTALVFDALQQLGRADLLSLCAHLSDVSATDEIVFKPAEVRSVLDSLVAADLVDTDIA